MGAHDGEMVTLYEADGCWPAMATGALAAVPVVEVLPVDGVVAPLIEADEPRSSLLGAVRKKWGALSIQGDGFLRARAGDIALSDLLQTVDVGGDV